MRSTCKLPRSVWISPNTCSRVTALMRPRRSKRSRPSIGKPEMCHASKERAFVLGPISESHRAMLESGARVPPHSLVAVHSRLRAAQVVISDCWHSAPDLAVLGHFHSNPPLAKHVHLQAARWAHPFSCLIEVHESTSSSATIDLESHTVAPLQFCSQESTRKHSSHIPDLAPRHVSYGVAKSCD